MRPRPELLAPQPQYAERIDRVWRPPEQAPSHDGELGDLKDLSVALGWVDDELKRLGVGRQDASPPGVDEFASEALRS